MRKRTQAGLTGVAAEILSAVVIIILGLLIVWICWMVRL